MLRFYVNQVITLVGYGPSNQNQMIHITQFLNDFISTKVGQFVTKMDFPQ